VFLNETRGIPDSLIISHMPHGPTAFFSLHNVVMRHDIGDKKHMSEQYPHLVFHEINSKIGKRVSRYFLWLYFIVFRLLRFSSTFFLFQSRIVDAWSVLRTRMISFLSVNTLTKQAMEAKSN
jgi:hypothetical protein